MTQYPVFRFKPSVEVILTQKDGILCVIPAEKQRFQLTGKGYHPDGNQPTHMGTIYSGSNDGLEFWLEPGWMERITEWADYA